MFNNKISLQKEYLFVCMVLFLSFSTFLPKIVFAGLQSDLQSKIDQRNADIANLEKEIQGYQKEIDALNLQANSLGAAIKSLDLTQKKLAADIQVTQGKIENKNLEITELGTQISDKEETIDDDRRIIKQSLIIMNQEDTTSIPNLLLSTRSLSNAWNSLDELGTLQNNLVNRVNNIRQVKANLEANKRATEKAKSDLLSLTEQLKDQRQVVVNTQSEKNKLLKETKQSESVYQSALAQKKALKDSFEKEVLDYESQLKTVVDASKLPHPGSGVLSWPLDEVKITQYFGNTPFATQNPQIYNGGGHTGIDLKASVGTPIKAALSGVVVGMGNTDLVSTCYSYGKWVMIKHNNGLSTLYAHLSLPIVHPGQTLTTGELLGYSGNTGYSTGPHLHFGVYATQGVEITSFKNSKNCPGVIIPFASLNAYLNPLSYL
jgi:murein DD-endopeptidase MepM/ murein hydrolase activator NlpD